MKEIKVGVLTSEEKKALRDMFKMENALQDESFKYHSALVAFWSSLRISHNLGNGQHYIRGNALYEQSLKKGE